MPVYSIQVPSGQTLDIQADTPDAAMAGAQSWHAQQTPSGITDNAWEGGADAAGGLAKTAEVLGGGPGAISGGLNAAADWMRPKDFVPSSIIDKAGFHPSAILPNLARAAAPTAATILAGMAAPEVAGTAGAIAAGTGAGLAMNAGNQIQTAADNRTGQPNSPITTPDMVRGGLTSVAQAVPQALPMARFLAPVGKLAKTGMAGVTDAATGLAKTSAAQGVASAASDVVGQVGQTIGTPGGTTVDPTQAANAGITGGFTGGLFGGKRAAQQALNATAFRGLANDPDMMQAATQAANRIQQNADNGNLNVGLVGGGSAQRLGAAAFTKTQSDIGSELKAAVGKLSAPLPVEAQNVLNSALKGQQPTPGGYNTLNAALQSDPQGANVMNLVRQAHAMDVFSNIGSISSGKFTGGIASHVTGMLTGHNVAKTGMVALGGAALEGGAGHLIAYSPEVMAAVAGAGALGRLADSVTGARGPAGRIVSNFADGTTPVRLPQPVAPQAPPVVRPGPTGPSVAPLATPWGTSTPAPEVVAPVTSGPPVATPGLLTPQVQAQMKALAALKGMAPKPAPEVVAPPTVIPKVPKELPTQWLQRMQAQNTAQDAVNASPFIAQKIGSADNVPPPAAVKGMSTAMRGASVLAKLQSDPEAEAEEAAQAKAAIQTAKVAAKAATISAKAAVKAPPPIDPATIPAKGPIDLPQLPLRGASVPTVGLEAMRAAVAGSPAATAAPHVPEKIVKTNGTSAVNDEPFPSSSYSHLPAQVAATHITNAAQAAGTVKFPSGFRASTQARIQGERNLMAQIGSEVPGLPIANLTARLEGAPDQTTAKAFREHLKQVYPRATASLDKHLSDEVIGRLWTRKSPPK